MAFCTGLATMAIKAKVTFFQYCVPVSSVLLQLAVQSAKLTLFLTRPRCDNAANALSRAVGSRIGGSLLPMRFFAGSNVLITGIISAAASALAHAARK